MMNLVQDLEKQSEATCPHCKKGLDRRFGSSILDCSSCGRIYHYRSASLGLEQLSVEPVNDLSLYPEITTESAAPYCDCELKEYLKTAIMCFGPHYCPTHNVIIIQGLFEPSELATIAEVTVSILNHETLHWVLYKNFEETISLSLDNDTVFDFVEAKGRN